MEKGIRTGRIKKTALIGLGFNFAYCVYHITYGVTTTSWWMLTIGIYYALLSIVRLVVLHYRGTKQFLVCFTGVMLIALSFSLVGTVVLAYVKDRGTVMPLIAMLATATYTFAKITVATVNWFKARKSKSVKVLSLRNISFANALVSIYSLQRSMLVSFDGMSATEIRIMNVLTGSAVCMVICWLGINLFQKHSSVRGIRR